jgi:hypothetical protein
MHFGLAVTLNHEDDHPSVGQHGSLLGYAGSLYEFPEDHLTIVVLTNTEGQNAYAISRALARAILKLPALPDPKPPAPEPEWSDVSVSADQIRSLDGTFVLTAGKLPPTLHDSYAQYRRTYRIFNENGRLMIQALGQSPERLLKQSDGTFRMASSPRTRLSFGQVNDHIPILSMESPGGLPLAGARVGPGDPQTFHRQLN